MTLLATSHSSPPADDLQPFERLAVALSASASTMVADEVDDALARATEEIASTFGVDECTLIDFGDPMAPAVLRSWASPSHVPCTDGDLRSMPWLLKRLSRNAPVTLTPACALPQSADGDREHAERSGVASRVAVPVALGTRIAYGLMLGSRQRHRQWPAGVVERLRLAGEILGAGLERVGRAERRSAWHRQEHDVDPAGAGSPAPGPEARPHAGAGAIIGESEALRLAMARVEQVAPLDATVLLLGETGTGKELIARAIHDRSRRRDRTLVRVNCAALPPSLIESELFGHERGAFTGAVTARHGRFELADGGTIFLDEIGDLAPELQTKLLRVLQEGEIERVGSSKTRRIDVRVIAATHVDLDAAVAAGQFRADLYYRIRVFPIALPPLRERREDIPALVWSFIRRWQRSLGRRIDEVPEAVMRALQHYDWPGNVRELENTIERAMIRSTGRTLQLDEAIASPATVPSSTLETLEAVQRRHIEKVLRECGWRINGAGNAAVRLGVHPNTLRFRMKKLGVVMPSRQRMLPAR